MKIKKRKLKAYKICTNCKFIPISPIRNSLEMLGIEMMYAEAKHPFNKEKRDEEVNKVFSKYGMLMDEYFKQRK